MARNNIEKNAEKAGTIGVISAIAVLSSPSVSQFLHTTNEVTIVALSALLGALINWIKQAVKK